MKVRVLVIVALASAAAVARSRAQAEADDERRMAQPATGAIDAEVFGATKPSPIPCGAACLAVAFQILGVEVHNAELGAMLDPTGAASFADIASVANSRGVRSAGVRLNPETLATLEHVAILRLQGTDGPHFIVTAGPAAEEVGAVIVFDPLNLQNHGAVQVSKFSRRWDGESLILSTASLDRFTTPARGALRNRPLGIVAVGLAIASVTALGWLWVARRGRRGGLPGAIVPLLLSMGVASHQSFASGAGMDDGRPDAEGVTVVGPLVQDFGPVEKGTRIAASFTLRNDTDATQHLSVSGTSCTCTSALFDREGVLPPGAQTLLAVNVETRRGGRLTSMVTVNQGDDVPPLVLVVTASVSNDTELSPAEVRFEEVRPGGTEQVKTIRLSHFRKQSEEFRILRAWSEFGAVRLGEVEPVATEPLPGDVVREEYSLAVTTNADASGTGDAAGLITIEAVDDDGPLTFEIPVFIRLLSRVGAWPDRVCSVDFDDAPSVMSEIALVPQWGPEVVRIRSAELMGPQPHDLRLAGWAQQDDGDRTAVRLEFSGWTGQRASGWLRLDLESPDGLVLRVPVLLLRLGAGAPGTEENP